MGIAPQTLKVRIVDLTGCSFIKGPCSFEQGVVWLHSRFDPSDLRRRLLAVLYSTTIDAAEPGKIRVGCASRVMRVGSAAQNHTGGTGLRLSSIHHRRFALMDTPCDSARAIGLTHSL
jgi:hypothetical protein